MPITLTQTDTAGGCSFNVFCSPNSADTNTTSAKNATSGGTAGTTAVSMTYDGSNTNRNSILFQSAANEPNNCSWESGTYIVRLEVTTANMNLFWSDITICRISSGCVNQATVFADTGPNGGISIGIGTTGVKTSSGVSGSAQTANATDQIAFILGFNVSTMTQAWAYKPSQNIDTPVTQSPGNCGAVKNYMSMPLMGCGIG